jgi:2-C-methyl-D-erythritol 4-phosphate cytidylyltransferase
MACAHAAIFPSGTLHDCLTRALNEGATITDEASALEYCGFHPELVAGRADNIKVTRPEDLKLAEFYLTHS